MIYCATIGQISYLGDISVLGYCNETNQATWIPFQHVTHVGIVSKMIWKVLLEINILDFCANYYG